MSEETKPLEITVRRVEDTKIDYIWFEEKLDNGQWVEIKGTRARCEGNSRTGLAIVVEKRRQQRLSIFRNFGPEETIKIDL